MNNQNILNNQNTLNHRLQFSIETVNTFMDALEFLEDVGAELGIDLEIHGAELPSGLRGFCATFTCDRTVYDEYVLELGHVDGRHVLLDLWLARPQDLPCAAC